jgi:hypothetical protein
VDLGHDRIENALHLGVVDRIRLGHQVAKHARRVRYLVVDDDRLADFKAAEIEDEHDWQDESEFDG